MASPRPDPPLSRARYVLALRRKQINREVVINMLLRDAGFLNYAVVTSDQRPTAGYAALAKDEFPDLTGGIDRLILASSFSHNARLLCRLSAPAYREKTTFG